MDDGPSTPHSRTFLIALISIVVIVSALIVWPFVTGTVFAIVFAYLLHPTYRRVLASVRYRPVAAGLVLLLVAVALVGPLVFIGYQLVGDVRELADTVADGGGFERTVVSALGRVGVDEAAARDLLQRATAAAVEAAQAAIVPTLSAVASVGANLLIFFFLLYYLLVDGASMVAFARRALPLAEERVDHLLTLMGRRVRALFLGTFLVSLIQGVAAGVGWWIFGFPAPFFWGFVMTILAILPGGAPFLVLVPAGFFAIVQGDVFSGAALLLYAVVVVGLIDNLARPFVISRSADVHPGVVIVGTLGGLVVFGATGFLLGPLALGMVGPLLTVFSLEAQASAAAAEAPRT